MRLVYSTLITLLLPLVVLRMLWRSRLAPAYRRRLGERLGVFTLASDSRPLLWIHAVSLGETLAARPLVERMLDELPGYRVLITTTTPTGSEQVLKLFGDRVAHVYAPWDTPGSVRRFLRRTRPQLLLLIETELWPNTLHYAAQEGCKIMLANARLSARSAGGYARFSQTTRRMFGHLSWVAAQSTADADRFVALGLDPARIAVSGSIKYDVQISESMRGQAEQLRRVWGLSERPSIIAASTHEGEEALILAAFRELRRVHPTALLLLAPRHPERFERVQVLVQEAGFEVLRRSSEQPVVAQTDVFLIDTLGELLQFFGVADLAIIGGSFIPRGGHNPLEATAWGRLVLCGGSMFNFSDISHRLREVGALEQVAVSAELPQGLPQRLPQEVPQELSQMICTLLGNPDDLQRRQVAALAVMQSNRGALDAQWKALRRLLGTH